MQNGIFNSNLYNSYAQYHSFVVDDPGLNGIGIGSYTLSSISGFFQSSGNKELLGGDKTNDFTCSTTSNLNLLYFNKSTKKYELKVGAEVLKSTGGESYSDLKSFLDDHDNNELGFSTSKGKADIDDIVTSIQNSYSGCITFSLTYTSQGCSSTTLIKLYLKNRKNSSTNRSIGLNGSPLISEVPRRATGAPYSYRGTEDLPIGAYQQPFQNGKDNPDNTISAPLKLTYNQSTGQWESGTQQILARLLTDIDPAPVTNNPSIFTNIDDISSEDLYDSESYAYLSEFTTGFALPLSKENGNPHQFGPNFNGCDTKKEKILVVNRTPQAFAKGSIVLCSNIDGEWIIQGFREDAKTTKIKVGKWNFQKYIADADNFFRSNNYAGYTYGWVSESKPVTPDSYENNARLGSYDIEKFTQKMNRSNIDDILDDQEIIDIAKLNLHTPRTKAGNKPYYDFDEIDAQAALNGNVNTSGVYLYNAFYRWYSILHHVGKHMGGKLEYNIFSRTNVEIPTAADPIEEGLLYQEEIPAFWGATFPDGYKSDQASLLKTTRPIRVYLPDIDSFADGSATAHIPFWDSIKPDYASDDDGENILSTGTDLNKGASGNLMFSNINDNNLSQLPGELAVISKNNPLKDYNNYFGHLEGGNFDFEISYADMLSCKFDKISLVTPTSGDIYGLDPISPNRIQFSPLQIEFAAHDYNNEKLGLIYENKPLEPQDKAKYDYLAYSFFNLINYPEGFVGRQSYLNKNKNNFPIGPATKLNGDGPIGWPSQFGPIQNGGLILPRADDKFQSGKSNIVGIIASKNTFMASESINFTTKQVFGLLPQKTVAGGQAGGLTILPVGGGLLLTTASNPGFTKALPQWGSMEDKYNSFGTTALHVRIFEAWPDNQTFYDGRYFSVIHINPIPKNRDAIYGAGNDSNIYYVTGIMLDSGVVYDGPTPSGGISSIPYERMVDVSETTVDFRIPTYGFGDNDGLIVEEDAIVDRNGVDNIPLRQPQEWAINPIRRGQVLTRGGFRYYRRTIGLNSENQIIRNAGAGFTRNQEITLERNVKIKIEQTGANGSISEISLLDKGINFLPPDFSSEVSIEQDKKYGYLANIPNSVVGGSGAQILFQDGVVYNRLAYDAPPLEMTTSPTRLTMPSYRGEKRAEGTLRTTIALPSNKINFDAFYFFHNDPLHTIATRGEPFIQAVAQYVILEIGGST